jgi:hypothetical protein
MRKVRNCLSIIVLRNQTNGPANYTDARQYTLTPTPSAVSTYPDARKVLQRSRRYFISGFSYLLLRYGIKM